MEAIADILIKIYIQFAIPLAITVALGATAVGKDDELMQLATDKTTRAYRGYEAL